MPAAEELTLTWTAGLNVDEDVGGMGLLMCNDLKRSRKTLTISERVTVMKQLNASRTVLIELNVCLKCRS